VKAARAATMTDLTYMLTVGGSFWRLRLEEREKCRLGVA
jgi:hypothetical protein